MSSATGISASSLGIPGVRLWRETIWPRVRLLWPIFGALVFWCLMAPPYLLVFRFSTKTNYWWGLKYIRLLQWFCGAKPITTVSPEVDLGTPCVFVSNHLSYLDIAVVMTTIPIWWRFIAMKKLRYVPVFGGVMKDLGNIFIDRSTTQRAYQSVKEAAEKITEGASILVYPEGGLSRDGEIAPFKRGAFTLAVEAQVPVVPIVMRKTNEVLNILRIKSRRGTVYCDVLAPIPTKGLTGEDVADLRARVRETMIATKRSLDRDNNG